MTDFIGNVKLDLSTLRQLRDGGLFCDIRVRVKWNDDDDDDDGDGEEYLCHKVVLMAASPMLASIIARTPPFQDYMIEDGILSLVPPVTPVAFNVLVDCIYGEPLTYGLIDNKAQCLGSLERIKCVLSDVQVAADLLGLNFAKDLCFQCFSNIENFALVKSEMGDEANGATANDSSLLLFDRDKHTDRDPGTAASSASTPVRKPRKRVRKRRSPNHEFDDNLLEIDMSDSLDDSSLSNGSGSSDYNLMPIEDLKKILSPKDVKKVLRRRKFVNLDPYPCPKCDKMINPGNQGPHVCKNPDWNIKISTEKHMCSLCAKEYSSKYGLQCHMIGSHGAPKQFKCSEDGCLKEFISKHSFFGHLFHTHNKNVGGHKLLQCMVEECNFVTIHNVAMRRHQTLHSDERPFKCGLCDQSFKQQRILRKHVQNVHGNLDLKCDQCDMTFPSHLKLKLHKRRVHGTQVKNWKCSYCEHTTRSKGNCRIHMRQVHRDMPVVVIDLHLEGAHRS